ncbi:O-antigen ligase family protein [Coraliomargarita sp. W4R72]
MDSSSGKHRRSSSRRRPVGGRRRHSPSLHRAPSDAFAPTDSFAPLPAASRGAIRLPTPKREPPVFKVFLAAFCGVVLLVLLGGSHHAVALGTALLLPGLALVLKPPKVGIGRVGDFGFIGLLACLLLAFIPQFYWPTSAWRLDAVESLGIELPTVLSVQPWISFEAWLMALAGFAWFYAALQWPVNLTGRRWLHFWLSLILCGLAAVVVWGNLVGARYPGAEDATAFSFFPNRNQTANFLALGGVATFAYAMEGLRSRSLLPLVGLPASLLCLTGLVLGVSRAGVILYFIGIGLWFICSLRARSMPRFFKIGFPLLVVAFSFVLSSNERTVQRIASFVSSESQLKDEFRMKIYQDTTNMVLAAPVSGFGLGSFSAVFPQYRNASANHQRVMHPESDLFWLASEGGVLALVFFAVFLFGYAWSCRGLTEGGSASYRLLALVAVIIFMLHSLVDVSAHRPGTAYFAIVFAALALPSRQRPASCLPQFFWRGTGGLLILFGLLWLAAGLFNTPWHSSVRIARDRDAIHQHVSVGDFEQAKSVASDWLSLQPLDWRAYFRRAQLTLSDTGNRAEAAADFRRARFVEPILGVVSYEEGRAWLPYDSARAISAWRETFFRELEDMDRAYVLMLRQTNKLPVAHERMARLSEIDPYHRAFFLRSLRGEDLEQEMAYELSKDPAMSRFSVEQRTEIVKNWIKRGDLGSAEAFLIKYGESLENSWWLWSLLLKDRADFEAAIDQIRKHIEVPLIPEVKLDESVLARLTREYAVAPKDIMKGTALVSIYLEEQNYEKALSILDRLLETHKPPLYLYYWRAECLYQLQDYIDSWYSFETYLEQVWGE